MAKKGEGTKATIVEKAVELFRERGFDKVSIGDICESAGVTRGTYYYHFKSKDEVLFGFYEAPEAIAAGDVAGILAAANCWEQLWLSYLPFLEYTRRAGAEVLAQCMRANMAENRGTFDPRAAATGISTAIIAKGQAAGQLRNQGDPAALNFVAVQLLIAYDFQWVVHKEAFEKISAMKGALELLFDVEPGLRSGASPLVE